MTTVSMIAESRLSFMPSDNFQIVGKITEIELIAVRHSIRILEFLQTNYGRGR